MVELNINSMWGRDLALFTAAQGCSTEQVFRKYF